MIRWLHAPQSPLVAKYVECYWLIKKDDSTQGESYPKLNPDPNAHLILSPSDQAYRYDMNLGTAQGQGSHLLSPHLRTYQLDHLKPFVHLGIKFRVGALYSLGIEQDSLLQLDSVQSMNLTEVFGWEQLDEELLIASALNTPELCCQQLDKLLQPLCQRSMEDKHSELTRAVLPLLREHGIAELGEYLYCSQRTVERSFNKVTGLTLKQCQTMDKLEALLVYLYQRRTEDIDWVEVACRFGFSDQPHLIRHLKKQIGLTPKAYAQQRGLTIDVYGGVETPILS